MANMTREEIDQILQQFGGLKAINRTAEARERASRHFWANEDRYLEEYPGKWIVVTVEGVAIVGDDLEKVVNEAHRLFAPDFAYHLDYMDPEKDSWLL